MSSSLLALGLAAGLLAEITAPPAPPAVGRSRTTAEIRIQFPVGSAGKVTLSPGPSRISLVVPKGSSFPLDFSAASGGLVSRADVASIESDRVRLDLELAQGVLDEVAYQPDGLVLRLQSRYAARDRSTPTGLEYRLGARDKLIVTVHNHPEMNTHPVVSAEGTINVPILGDVQAAGLSTTELSAQLAERYGRDILVNPEIDVAIEEYESQWVMVSGEVRLPGRVKLKGGTSLKEVLSEAQGFSADAGEEIRVSRKEVAGKETVVRVDRGAFERGEDNPVLQHGDIVDVSRTEYCYVKGEVRSPGRVRIERGLTLIRALTLTSGLTEWAQEKSVKILAPDGQVRVYNLKRIQRGEEPDPVLSGGELVVVERRFF